MTSSSNFGTPFKIHSQECYIFTCPPLLVFFWKFYHVTQYQADDLLMDLYDSFTRLLMGN